MAQINYNDIVSIDQSWENYAGSSVEKFIKKQLNSKAGYIYRSSSKEGDYYYLYGFTSYEDFEKWAGGDSSIVPLFKVQLPNIENDTFSVNLTTNSNTSKLVNLGEGVIINLRYTSISTNPTTGVSTDTYNDGTLIIQRSANGSTFTEVGRVTIQPTPNADPSFKEFNLTPYLVDGDNKFRLRVEDTVNGSVSATLVFNSVINTTLAIQNATSTANPLRALQFQYYIQGQVDKTLHIKISQDGSNQTFDFPLGQNTYIEVPYTTPVINMGVETGIVEVEAWLSVDDTTVTSYKEVNQFYYTDGSATSTVIILNEVSNTIINYTNQHLFDMTLYNNGDDVEVTIKSQDGNTDYLTLTYNNCQTGVVYPVYATLELESNADTIPALVVVTSNNFNCTPYSITIDNTEKMSPVSGATFVLNPKVRNNSEEHPNTIINSVTGSTVSSTFTGFGFINDGWVSDDDNIGVLRIPSQHSLTINYDPLNNLTNGTSIELDYKVYNIFNDSDEVVKMYTTNENDDILGFVMCGTEAEFYTAENQVKRDQDVIFQEGVRTHLVVNIIPNLSNSSLNYIRIFVNGVLNREMLYSNTDVFKSGVVSMVFGSQNCDIDIYGLRIYKTGLSASDIRQNYMSSLPTIEDKTTFKEANNILSANGTISYDRARVKYNTLVWTGQVPSYLTGNREYQGKLQVNIIDDPAHSGTMTNLKIKGQGSSSRGYWKWNHQFDWNKLNEDTVWTDGNGTIHTDGYTLTDNDPAAVKLVSKLNWASSMQSHKLGSTAMYTDLWRLIVGGNSITKTSGYEKVRVTVDEKPFLYFVKDSDNAQPVFYGLVTFGSAKYDKPTFGYDKNVFPDYLILEGSDNGMPLTLRQVPWFTDEVTYNAEEEYYEYAGQGNLDYGMGKQENIYYFQDAFNFTYLHSPFLTSFTGSISEDADKKYQYWDTVTKNVYRYDYISQDWVNAGTTKTNGEYDVLNLESQTGLYRTDYSTDAAYTDAVITWRKTDFKNRISVYYNTTDVLYSIAFLKLIGASDNRCKNTYEYLDPVTHKICLAQDDMDTLMLTDNVGRKTKPYYVEEYDLDPDGKPYFNGSDNVFFCLMDSAFDAEEKAMMKQILTTMVNLYDSVPGCIQHYFFAVQEYFPATAYNETARLLYEEASVKQSQGIYVNGTPAISQSLGDQLQAERQWWNRRIPYMQSWSSSDPFYTRSTTEPNLQFRSMTTTTGNNPEYSFALTPWQYLYPKVGTGQFLSYDNTRVPARTVYNTVNMTTDGNTDTFIYGSNYYTSYGEFGGVSLSETFNLVGDRLLEFSADTREVVRYDFRPSRMNINCPQLRSLCLYGCSTLAGSLDISGSDKLVSIDLRGTGLNSVTLPETTTLTTVYLPNLTSIYLNNLPNLISLNIQSYSNLVNLNTDREDLGLDAMLYASNLQQLTLNNIDITTTSSNANAVYNVLVDPDVDCNITGHIYLAKALTIEEVSALKNKYGIGVFDPDSSFYITYITTPITVITLTSERKTILSGDNVTVNSTFNGNELPKSFDWTISGTDDYTLTKNMNSVIITSSTVSVLENITITYTITRQDDTVLTQTITLNTCPYVFRFKYTNPSGQVVYDNIFNHTFDALFSNSSYANLGPVEIDCTDNVVFTFTDTKISEDSDGNSATITEDGNNIVIMYGDISAGGGTPWQDISGFENWGPYSASTDTPAPLFDDEIVITVNGNKLYIPYKVQTCLYRINDTNNPSTVTCVNGSATVQVNYTYPAIYQNVIHTFNCSASYYNGASTGIIFGTNITNNRCDYIVTGLQSGGGSLTYSIGIELTNPYGGNTSAFSGEYQYLTGITKNGTITLVYQEAGPSIIAEYSRTGQIGASNVRFYLFSSNSTFAGWDKENSQYIEESGCSLYFPVIDNTYTLTWDSVNKKYTYTDASLGTITVYPSYNNQITAEIPIKYFGNDAVIGATVEMRFTLHLDLNTSSSFGGLICAFSGVTELISVEIQNARSIGYMCFSGCTGLTTATLNLGITSISNSLFYGCTSLTSIIVPQGVTSIGTDSFKNCSDLVSLTLPSSVTSISSGSFSGCVKLNTIVINRIAPNISSDSWGSASVTAGYSSGTSNVLYVPSGATGYNNQNWTSHLLNVNEGKFTLSPTL